MRIRYKEYNYMMFNGKRMPQYRFIWIINKGAIQVGMMIHHINGIKTDDRIENLECVDRLTHGLRHRNNQEPSTVGGNE